MLRCVRYVLPWQVGGVQPVPCIVSSVRGDDATRRFAVPLAGLCSVNGVQHTHDQYPHADECLRRLASSGKTLKTRQPGA